MQNYLMQRKSQDEASVGTNASACGRLQYHTCPQTPLNGTVLLISIELVRMYYTSLSQPIHEGQVFI